MVKSGRSCDLQLREVAIAGSYSLKAEKEIEKKLSLPLAFYEAITTN
jgi:hypothetical protein